jgi:hypothetical protein
MLLFYFVDSLVIYKQELDGDSTVFVEFNYRLEEIRWEVPDTDADGSRDISYDYIAFEEIEKVMQNMKNLALLLVLASAFLIWKIKEVIDGSDDLEIVQKAGYAVSVIAIFSVLYPVYAIPNALEDEWKDGFFNERDEGYFDYDTGFIGEQEVKGWESEGITSSKSGPETGWYILVLGGILGILIYNCVKDLENLGPSRKPPIVKDSVVSKSKSEELRDAKALLDDGVIDAAEFQQMKKEILGK